MARSSSPFRELGVLVSNEFIDMRRHARSEACWSPAASERVSELRTTDIEKIRPATEYLLSGRILSYPSSNDVPPVLSSTAVWSPIPHRKELWT